MVCMSDRVIGGSTPLVMSDCLNAGCGENGRDIASEHDMNIRCHSNRFWLHSRSRCYETLFATNNLRFAPLSKKIAVIHTQLVDFYRIPIVSVDIRRLGGENLL